MHLPEPTRGRVLSIAECRSSRRDRRRGAGIACGVASARPGGIALARYAVLVEPLAAMSPEEVIEVVAPTFQHCLVEPLTA
jgi:hypothetical protein